MKIFTGSGVLPIFILDKTPYLITFTVSRGIISDAGGKKESSDNILNTACRELFEESAGLIHIDENNLENNSIYIDIKNNNKYYRSYFIIINDIDTTYYDENLEKFKKFNFNPFTETHGIKLMKLNNIDLDNNKIKMTNIDNYKLILAPRLTQIIKRIIKKYNKLNIFYKELKNNVDLIKLKKIKQNISSYEYDTYKKIKINNIISFSSEN